MADDKDKNKKGSPLPGGIIPIRSGRLPLLFLHDTKAKHHFVPFPGVSLSGVCVAHEEWLENALRAEPYVLVGHIQEFAEKDGRKIPKPFPIGVFAVVAGWWRGAIEGEKIIYMDLMPLVRVALANVSEEDASVPTAEWRSVLEYPLSREDFQSPDIQRALSAISIALAPIIAIYGKSEGLGKDFAEEFDTTHLSEESFGLFLDRCAFLFNAFIHEEEIQRQLWLILADLHVMRRAAKLIALIRYWHEHPELFPHGEPSAGSGGNAPDDIDDIYEEKKPTLPPHVQEAIEQYKEYAKSDTESGRIHAEYIKWLLALPWNAASEDEKDFAKVSRILKEGHEYLDEPKDRILDFLAVRRLKSDAKAPILCFVGPPGVGKTSLGQAIADAMGRKFVRRSLGALKDEAELRGHRRTYIGALPGIIIAGLRQAGTKNPVFMLDEVDKLGQHGKDIPENALLEILDSEQNFAFIDHYLNISFDLSQVLFITTANITDTIHDAVLNRMEIIELPGYTEDEKVAIAERHIVSKVHQNYGMTFENFKRIAMPPFGISFSEKSLRVIASQYASDAGMRDTERFIKRVAHKIIREISEGKSLESVRETAGPPENGGAEKETSPAIIRITTRNLKKYLGEPKQDEWLPDLGLLKPGVGIVLMVSSSGIGKIGFVEVSYREDDHFNRKSTGSLQKVLEESIEVSVSRLIHHGGILEGISHKKFFHFHFPDGATPKDGPSAGLQIPSTLYSALLGVPLKPFFAATGELPLVRKVALPVGGIRAKLLAAERYRIKEVAIPFANAQDLEKFPKRLRDNMRVIMAGAEADLRAVAREQKDRFTVYCVNTIEEVLTIAFPDHFPPSRDALERLTNKTTKQE